MTARLGAGTSRVPASTGWLVVALCFFPVFMDGFDSAILALSVPALARDWGISAAAFTFPLVAMQVGVVVGYMASGWMARHTGRRRLLVGSVGLFSLGTLVTAQILPLHSVEALGIVRLLTGLGFGGAYPSAVAFAAAFSAHRHRQIVPLVVTLGFATGGTAAGFSQQLIAVVGVSGLFWSAGLASAAATVSLLLFLPRERTEAATADGPRGERVGRLFERAVRVDTLLLWVFAFVAFLVSTALISWVPVLLTGLGFSVADAPMGLAFVFLGAILGAVAVIPVAAWLGIGRTLVAISLIGSVFLLLPAGIDIRGMGLLILLAVAGVGISGSQSGQVGVAVALYPPEQRTTGIGWASAMGKAGSVAGPSAGGLMLGLGASASTIFAVAGVAMAVAVGCAVVLALRARPAPRDTRPTDERPSGPAGE